MRAKKADGSWTEPFDPLKGSRDYVEATPWQYRFFVPHDIAGLEAMMGGRERMLAAVDSLFNYRPEGQESVDRDIRGILGQYAQGNEPDHNFPWLFNYIGEPSKSQEVVRWLLLNTYHSGPDGICGNEDCGQMSAWYILASLGIYPACPGTGEYIFSAPLFKEAEIRLGNGNSLLIKADHPKRPFISAVTLNGKPVTRNFLTYDEIMGGGTLAFKLSSKPDHRRDNLTAPYSMTTAPVVSKPFIEGDLHLFQEEAEIRMGCRTEGAVIRYTLDGSEPTADSAAIVLNLTRLAARVLPAYHSLVSFRILCTLMFWCIQGTWRMFYDSLGRRGVMISQLCDLRHEGLIVLGGKLADVIRTIIFQQCPDRWSFSPVLLDLLDHDL